MSCHTTVSSMSHLKSYIVRRLDGVDQDVNLDKKANGSELLDRVCKSLGIMEKEYFGLQFTDKNGDHLWLNLRNPLHEQLPQSALRPTVEMRVKYFVSPQKLMQSITRVQFYKHLRKELVLGRIGTTSAKAARLTALIAQIDKGDHHVNFQYRHKIPCCSSDMDNYDTRIRREHSKLVGTPPELAVERFLSEAATLEHYGVEFYHAMDANRTKMNVGVGPECMVIVSPQMEILQRYNYDAIQYTAFHARKFTALVQPTEEGRGALQLEYELKSRSSAQALYRSVTEFHTFFKQEKVSGVVRSAGYCKSLIGSFKGQSPDRFYFDVTRTHSEVVDHLWPILHPNTPPVSQSPSQPPPLPRRGFPTSSMLSISSQQSTRSLPSNNPNHHHRISQTSSMTRSISTDNTFRRSNVPPPFNAPVHPVSPATNRRNLVHTSSLSQPPPHSPFNPYASSIDCNSSDSDDQSATYVSASESDTYVCMRSSEFPTQSPEHYIQTGSDSSVPSSISGFIPNGFCHHRRQSGPGAYIETGSDMNSGASEISSLSLEDRIPSPPPVYSEIDPHMPTSPDHSVLNPARLTISGILGTQLPSGVESSEGVFNFDTTQVLARTRELESELLRLRSAMVCRTCHRNPIGATFIPCGHTICCYTCAQRLRQCWECDQPITTVQKMLLA